MTVRFTEKEDAQLAKLAEIWGVSKQQAVTKAIQKTLEDIDYDVRVSAAKDFIYSEYGDLIKRLGE